MSLRNKLAILSITLMSLLTIPTRAENNTKPVSSRIENTEFVVDVTAPKGWAVTDRFEAIPAKVEFTGHLYHTLKFANGTPSSGCVILFSSDSDILKESFPLSELLLDAYQLAFPGSVPTSFLPSKWDVTGSAKADIAEESIKASLGGSLEGVITTESGSAPLIANGKLETSLDEKIAIATGKITSGEISGVGAVGFIAEDGYRVIITAWGSDEEKMKNEIIAFSKALKVTPKKVPATTEETKVTPQEAQAPSAAEVTPIATKSAAVDPVNSTTKVRD